MNTTLTPAPRAATHDGTCQICGARQRLPGDRLAAHGYTTEHGYFEGVCPGSYELPLETDCLVLARHVTRLRAFVAREAEKIAAYAARTPDPAKVAYRVGGQLVTGALADEEGGVYFVGSGARVRLANAGHTAAVAKRLHDEHLGRRQGQQRMLEIHLARMTARLIAWEKGPLLALTVRGAPNPDAPKRGPSKKALAAEKYRAAYREKYGREALWGALQTTSNNDVLREAAFLLEGHQTAQGAAVYATDAQRRRMMRALADRANHEGVPARLAFLSELLGAAVTTGAKGRDLLIDGQEPHVWERAHERAHEAACQKLWE